MMESIKALLLVGGKGTRLRSVVPSTPKPLAAVGSRPFLELLIHQLRMQGIDKLVLCTGYRAKQIEQVLGDGSNLHVTIDYSRESIPLGTAGAIKRARKHLHQLDDFLVLNGDSFLDIDFRRMIEFHRNHSGMATIAAVPVANADRYGLMETEANNRITSFVEKSNNSCPGLINAGIYVFGSKVLEHIPPGPVSLEKDILPNLLTFGVYAFEQQGTFIDIGCPADYARAQKALLKYLKPLEDSSAGLSQERFAFHVARPMPS